jgi:hypothetical protein
MVARSARQTSQSTTGFPTKRSCTSCFRIGGTSPIVSTLCVGSEAEVTISKLVLLNMYLSMDQADLVRGISDDFGTPDVTNANLAVGSVVQIPSRFLLALMLLEDDA